MRGGWDWVVLGWVGDRGGGVLKYAAPGGFFGLWRGVVGVGVSCAKGLSLQ